MRTVAYRNALPITADESLIDCQQSAPSIGARDLLVQVKAISVNPVDVKIRANVNPSPDAPKVLGWDAAGTVVAIGSDVTLFRPGDEVFYAGALDRPGANSEMHVVDERIVGHKPSRIDFAQAAALPLTGITAWEALFERLDVAKTVPDAANAILIIGGAGGVGSMAIQLARALTHLTVIATASREVSKKWCLEMGAHHVIDHTLPLASQIAELGIGQPAFVFSTTHTESYLSNIVELIAPQGRLCLIDDPKSLDVLPFKRKSVSVHWEFMFTRSLFQTADMKNQHKLLENISQLINEGKIKSTMTEKISSINSGNLKKAHAMIESGKTVGKVVLCDWE